MMCFIRDVSLEADAPEVESAAASETQQLTTEQPQSQQPGVLAKVRVAVNVARHAKLPAGGRLGPHAAHPAHHSTGELLRKTAAMLRDTHVRWFLPYMICQGQ